MPKICSLSTHNPFELEAPQRRALLKATAVTLAGSLFLPRISAARCFLASEKCLHLYHSHTGETLKAVYWAEGKYLSEGLQEINRLFRDFRTGDIKPIDPGLIDLLHAIALKLDTTRAFHVVSAYRSPKTNTLLRRKSKKVAKHSYHTKGRAIDIRLPQVALKNLHRAALSLQSGGVGYYGRSNFIHVDTGPVRSWGK